MIRRMIPRPVSCLHGLVRRDLLLLVRRHSRPPGSWFHEDRGARQSDRASAQGAQEADAQERPVPGDEAGVTPERCVRGRAATPGRYESTSVVDEECLRGTANSCKLVESSSWKRRAGDYRPRYLPQFLLVVR